MHLMCVCMCVCVCGVCFNLVKACGMWYLSFPDQGLTPQLLHWKLGILTTGWPGKSSKYTWKCHPPASLGKEVFGKQLQLSYSLLGRPMKYAFLPKHHVQK